MNFLAPIQATLAKARSLLLARQDDEAQVLLNSANKAASASLVVLDQRISARPTERDLQLRTEIHATLRTILQAKLMLSMAGYRFHGRTPPKAGDLLRIPLLATGNGTVPAGRSFDAFGPGVGNVTLESADLPWFRYRLEGVLVQRAVTLGSLLDNVVAESLRWSGGTSVLMTEISADTMRAGNTQWIGLRAKPIIEADKRLTLNLNCFSAANAAPAGNSMIAAMAIITVLDDYPQRDMVPAKPAPSYPSFGYVDSGPDAGQLLRVAMEVESADAINAVGSPAVRLSAAVPSVTLISREVQWDTYRVVGIETVSPVRQATTDFLTLSNLRGSNSIDLLGEVGELPIEAFLLDESDRGGGSSHLAGLRKHQTIKAPGRMRVTVSGWDGLTGNAGTTATTLLNGVNLLVNVDAPTILYNGETLPQLAHRQLFFPRKQ